MVKPGLEPGTLFWIFHTPPTEPPPTDRFTTLAVKVILIQLTVTTMLNPTYCATDYSRLFTARFPGCVCAAR